MLILLNINKTEKFRIAIKGLNKVIPRSGQNMQIKLNMLTNASRKKVKIEGEEWGVTKTLTIVLTHLFLLLLPVIMLLAIKLCIPKMLLVIKLSIRIAGFSGFSPKIQR